MRILGLDPGLLRTGWGLIESQGSSLIYLQSGVIAIEADQDLPVRLARLADALEKLLFQTQPDEAAIEETFVNKNAASALKLGQARGVVMAMPARGGVFVAEYAANVVKKAVVGTGHADKNQIAAMVRVLLPRCGIPRADEADALAVAICHAHHASLRPARKVGMR